MPVPPGVAQRLGLSYEDPGTVFPPDEPPAGPPLVGGPDLPTGFMMDAATTLGTALLSGPAGTLAKSVGIPAARAVGSALVGGGLGAGAEATREIATEPSLDPARIGGAAGIGAAGDLLGTGVVGVVGGAGRVAGRLGKGVFDTISARFGGGTFDDLWRYVNRGRKASPDEMDAAAFNSALDSWAKNSEITPAQKVRLDRGDVMGFVKDEFDVVTKELGPTVDQAQLAEALTTRAKGLYQTQRHALKKAYRHIDDQIGGEAELIGPRVAPKHPYVTDASGQPISESPMPLKGDLGDWPSRNVRVKPGTGIQARGQGLRAYAQRISFPGADTDDALKRARGLVDFVATLPNDVPYKQLEALRHDVGSAMEMLPDKAPEAARNALKGLYGQVATEQRKALVRSGHGNLASLHDKVTGLWKENRENFNPYFFQKLSENVDPLKKGSGDKAADALLNAKPAELQQAMKVLGPHKRRFQQAVLQRGLRQALQPVEVGGVETLNGKALQEWIGKNRDRLQVLVDDPKLIGRWERLAAVHNFATSDTTKKKIGEMAIQEGLGQGGAVFSRVVRDKATGRVTTMEAHIPIPLVAALLSDPFTSKSFVEMAVARAGALGKYGAGVGSRQVVRHAVDPHMESWLAEVPRVAMAAQVSDPGIPPEKLAISWGASAPAD